MLTLILTWIKMASLVNQHKSPPRSPLKEVQPRVSRLKTLRVVVLRVPRRNLSPRSLPTRASLPRARVAQLAEPTILATRRAAKASLSPRRL